MLLLDQPANCKLYYVKVEATLATAAQIKSLIASGAIRPPTGGKVPKTSLRSTSSSSSATAGGVTTSTSAPMPVASTSASPNASPVHMKLAEKTLW